MQAVAKKAKEPSSSEQAKHQKKPGPEEAVVQREINPLWHSMATNIGGQGLDPSGASSSIQTKLTMGAPDDPYEKEADAVADTVMRSPTSVTDDLENPIQTKPTTISPIQRLCAECGDDEVQNKPVGSGSTNQLSGVNKVVTTPGSGEPLSSNIRQKIEPVLGSDLSQVRVHSDSQSQAAASEINAKAFTNKSNIYLGANQSSNDIALMAHEATHTVQQSGRTLNVRIQRQPKDEDPNCYQNGDDRNKWYRERLADLITKLVSFESWTPKKNLSDKQMMSLKTLVGHYRSHHPTGQKNPLYTDGGFMASVLHPAKHPDKGYPQANIIRDKLSRSDLKILRDYLYQKDKKPTSPTSNDKDQFDGGPTLSEREIRNYHANRAYFWITHPNVPRNPSFKGLAGISKDKFPAPDNNSIAPKPKLPWPYSKPQTDNWNDVNPWPEVSELNKPEKKDKRSALRKFLFVSPNLNIENSKTLVRYLKQQEMKKAEAHPIEYADEHDDISQESHATDDEGDFDLSGLIKALTPTDVKKEFWFNSDNPSIQYADPRLSKRDLASIVFGDAARYMDIEAVDSNLYKSIKPGFLTYRLLSTTGITSTVRKLIEEKVIERIKLDIDILHNMSQEFSWTGNDSSKVVYTIIKWSQMAHLSDVNGLSYLDRFLKAIDGGSYDGGSKTLLKDLYDDLDVKYQHRVAAVLRFSSKVYNADSRFDFAAIDRVVEGGITSGDVIGRFYDRENYGSYRIYVQVVQVEGTSFDQVDFEMRNSPVYMTSRMNGAKSAFLDRNRAVVPHGGKFYGVSLITDQEGYVGGFDWETGPYEMELIWYHKGTKLIRNERYNPEYDTTKPVSPANVTLIKDMIEERQQLLQSGSVDIGDYVALFTLDYDALNAIGPTSRRELMGVIFQALTLSSGSNRGLYKYFFRTLQRVMSVMLGGELESFVAWMRTNQYVDKVIDWSRIIESDPDVDTALIVGQLIVAGFHTQQDFQNEPLVLDDTYTFNLGSKANTSNDLFFYYVHADTTIGSDGKEYITLKQYREEEGLFGSNSSPSSPNYTSVAILPTTMVPVRITFTDEDGNEIQNQEMIISAFELAVFGQTLTEVIQAGKFRMDMMIFGINLIFILFLLSGIGALLRLLATLPLRLLLRQGALVFLKEIGKKLVSQKAKSIFVRIIIDTIFLGIEKNRAALQRTEDGRTFLSIYHVLLMTLIAGMSVKFLLSTALMNRLIVYGVRVLPTISNLAARAGLKTTLADIAAMSKAAGRLAPELATAGGPELTGAMETSFMVAFREERVSAGRDLVLGNVGGGAAAPATKTALTKLYTELESAAATDTVRSKLAVNITRALEQMSTTEVATFLPKANQLIGLYPAASGDLLVLNFMKAAVKSRTPSLFLDDVLALAAKGFTRDALRGIAFKLAINKPVLTLEWLLRGKGNNIPPDQMNLLGADKYTKWGTLMNPEAVDFASTIRGIGGELVAIKGGIFPGYTISATQVKVGRSLLDVIYKRTSTTAKKAVEVKSWNLVRWKNNLRQYDRLMRGESLTRVELREANQIKTLLKQLEDAGVATSLHERPALVLSDVIKGENMQLAGSTAKIKVTKQLNSVLTRDLPGTNVQLKYIKENAIRAERDILEKALRGPK